ncbi:MAG: alcohol dehydrogenase catalytic domain-containing protein [Spirochaetia bacterium]|nr:alcohol dehydrogenase catalytic domain-containing protein [Spirochaetia bacterium]
MTSIRFQSPEYTKDGSFSQADFIFEGDEESGWKIFRNGKLNLELGPGYVAVRSISCGVCSTDLARKFLPYPLPQITGHEVVGLYNDRYVTVEINASHKARGLKTDCSFCNHGMDTQCPERITLGIDRLPGGFSPWFLAPQNAIIEIPEGVSTMAATLTEPFAAALHAVEASGVKDGIIAVLGPRRLGMLALAALRAFREEHSLNFRIHALVRHKELYEMCLKMGADECIDVREKKDSLFKKYDLVFDTTGNPDGLKAALKYARRAVHLKSTNGQAVMGMDHLTDMVVDEISLLPYSESSLDFTWASEKNKRKNLNVYLDSEISESVTEELKQKYPKRNFYQITIEEAKEKIDLEASLNGEKGLFLDGSPFPRFDLAIASSLKSADRIIRPVPGEEFSILRPRGAILLKIEDYASELDQEICSEELELHSSRCGSFERALDLMKNNSALVSSLEKMVTHRFKLGQISEAFSTAGDSSKSIKVLVETDANPV